MIRCNNYVGGLETRTELLFYKYVWIILQAVEDIQTLFPQSVPFALRAAIGMKRTKMHPRKHWDRFLRICNLIF